MSNLRSHKSLRRSAAASRSYKLGTRTLTAVVYKAVRCPPHAWCAEFAVRGQKTIIRGRAFGVDQLQALLLAVQGLRLKLEALGAELRWIGGEHGDTGIPRLIPIAFGLEFSKRAERVLDKEVTRFVRGSGQKRRKPKRAPSSVRTRGRAARTDVASTGRGRSKNRA